MPAEVWSAPALFLACLVSGILVPVPEDVALLVAGWQMHEGSLPVATGALAGFLGTFARDALAFGAGRLALAGVTHTAFLARWMDTPRLTRMRQSLERRGDPVLFLTRFAIGFRSVLYFAGGSTGRPFRRFMLLDGLGLLLTTPLLLGLGWAFGPQAEATVRMALSHQRVVQGVLVTAVLVVVVVHQVRRRRAALRNQPPLA